MQNPNEDFGGFAWIALGVVAYAISYALVWIGVLNDTNSEKFSTRTSGGIAAFIGLAAVEPIENIQEALGGVAIFILAWFCLGLIFSIATSMALEHQNK